MAYLEDMEEYLEYDAEKTNNFISNLQHEQHKYAVKADALYNAHDRYCNNDTFVGESADTTKRYIHLVWKKYIEDIDTLQKGIYKQYCDMADTFSKTVDSSPKARIKIPVLKKIRSDYREMYDSLEYHGKNIMRIAQDLEDKFGKYGEVTQPNYHRAMDVFDEFCGTGGFLDKCIKKMVEFDDYCSNAIDKSGLKDMADNTVDRLFNSKYALSSMTVYDPSVEQTTVNMAALQAGAIKIPWLKGHLQIKLVKNNKSEIEEGSVGLVGPIVGAIAVNSAMNPALAKINHDTAEKYGSKWNIELGDDAWTTADIIYWKTFGGNEFLFEKKSNYVKKYNAVIRDAAQKYAIPEKLLAGIVFNEYGGDPLWIDDFAYNIRDFDWSGDDETDEKTVTKKPELTSFGNLSLQVRRVAEMYGYNPDNLTSHQAKEIINDLKDPVKSTYIAAAHLSDLKDIDYADIPPEDMDDDMIRDVATRYNRGPDLSLDEIHQNTSYGNSIFKHEKEIDDAMEG